MKDAIKTALAVFLAALLVMPLVIVASSHSGRTDANGGHYNRSTGEYHYHHGYPAHQHENGVCPYDDAEKDAEDSGGSTNGKLTVGDIERKAAESRAKIDKEFSPETYGGSAYDPEAKAENNEYEEIMDDREDNDMAENNATIVPIIIAFCVGIAALCLGIKLKRK